MKKKVTIGMCGSAGPLDEYNPFRIMREEIAAEILHILNKGPLTISGISKVISRDEASIEMVIKSLLKINALRKENGKCRVNFAIFSKEDQRIIFNIGKKYGKQLASELLNHRKELSNSAKEVSCANFITKDKILFALVGCFGLDWHSLEELEKMNFLRLHKKQPGKRDYLLLGRERSGISIRRLYWGSHSESVGKYTFTSFGDDAGPRSCLPDTLWQASGAVSEHIKGDRGLREAFANALSLYGKNLLRDCGQALELLARGDVVKNMKFQEFILSFLERLEYISRKGKHYNIRIPVFLPKDEEIIRKIEKRTSKVACDFVAQKYPEMKDALSKTRPILNKVPIDEVFNDVWHKIFAYCNMFLAEEGFMYDPPETPYHSRYLPWVTVTEENKG